MSKRDYEGPSLEDAFSHFTPEKHPTKEEVERMLKEAKAAKPKPNPKLESVKRELDAVTTQLHGVEAALKKMLKAAYDPLVGVIFKDPAMPWCGHRKLATLALKEAAKRTGLKVSGGTLVAIAEKAIFAHLNSVPEWVRLKKEQERLEAMKHDLRMKQRDIEWKMKEDPDEVVWRLERWLREWGNTPPEGHPLWNAVFNGIATDEALREVVKKAVEEVR